MTKIFDKVRKVPQIITSGVFLKVFGASKNYILNLAGNTKNYILKV